jgi:hypothetical protein
MHAARILFSCAISLGCLPACQQTQELSSSQSADSIGDDGATSDGPIGSADCDGWSAVPVCGDGMIEAGEVCDDAEFAYDDNEDPGTDGEPSESPRCNATCDAYVYSDPASD